MFKTLPIVGLGKIVYFQNDQVTTNISQSSETLERYSVRCEQRKVRFPFLRVRFPVYYYKICQSFSGVQLFATPQMQPVRLLCPRNSPGKNTGVDCHSLLQRIFQTQGLNCGLLHHRQILYHLNYREFPYYIMQDL